MLKKILQILLIVLLLAIIISLLPIGFVFLMSGLLKDNVIEDYIFMSQTERYFEGTGHCDDVILTGSNIKFYRLKLDNFTKDAYDIVVSSLVEGSGHYWDSPHYWLRFSYETFSTYCPEVDESKTAMPYLLLSPDWWPRELGKYFIPTMRSINRSNYKFYCCDATRISYGYAYFEYFAVDNITKKGYYWRTMRTNMSEDDIQKYY
ncbi:hypothetical protein [Candidatus Magnetominusculus xianensis]|uniref:Uncharacterized protein n=1 Tax=Candidatus Magnetominusculus xianensis TaxID=1748249 RepID=A0ABR5SC60_9BACT|nr:hypothetical protein [Candidatus Magnetominusculus xianensis]KWT78409.1 hypothetical protein ASN18_2817 [Candidatus Magnetominusculus xianensis]MBF0403164.1 hypothetical protein [Nitrospirota bacterium]